MPPISTDKEDVVGGHVPVIAPRIGAARDVEEKMRKWSEGMEPRFISWNVAAIHTFDFTFYDAWSRKKIKAPPSRRPGVSVDVWNDLYTPADDRRSEGDTIGSGKGVQRRHVHDVRRAGAIWRRIGRIPGE